MATTFDEVLLSTNYSALVDGGAEFATHIADSGASVGVTSRDEIRADYLSKYEIAYGEMDADEKAELRTFGILRKGMARGFRFFAHGDNEFEAEAVGWLDPETETIVPVDGSEEATDFYLIKHYEDVENSYTRRIVKPSPYDDLLIEWWDISGTPFIIGDTTMPANSYGAIIAETTEFVIFAPGAYNFTINWHEGLIISALPLPADSLIRVTGTYHLPAAFTDDWHRFAVDEEGISEFKIGVEEILPQEIGITV